MLSPKQKRKILKVIEELQADFSAVETTSPMMTIKMHVNYLDEGYTRCAIIVINGVVFFSHSGKRCNLRFASKEPTEKLWDYITKTFSHTFFSELKAFPSPKHQGDYCFNLSWSDSSHITDIYFDITLK